MIAAEIQEEVMSRFNNSIQIETKQLTGQNSYISINHDQPTYNYLINPDYLTRMSFRLTPNYTSDITWQNVVKECILPSYHSKNMKKLEAAFFQENNKRVDYLGVDKLHAKKMFEKTASLIAELPFVDGTIELTKGKGFKFILVFPNNRLLMISKTLNSSNSPFSEDEIIYSLFINRELIASNAAELAEFKEGFKKYLSM